MKKMFCIDIDGTLLKSNGTISYNTVSIIKKLKEQGHEIVLCSARSRNAAISICKLIDTSKYVISSNGAEIYDYYNNDVIKIKILKKSYNEDINMIKNNFSDNFLLNENLTKWQVITNDMFVSKEEYEYMKEKELISLDLNKDDIVTNSKLRKNLIINIYSTQEFDNKIQTNMVLENVQIVDVFDDNANSIHCSNKASKIMLYAPRDKVVAINNLKEKEKIKISIIN